LLAVVMQAEEKLDMREEAGGRQSNQAAAPVADELCALGAD
jgi:hypothetical protein